MGTFTKRVRQGKVASPTTPRWSETEWTRAYEAAQPHDDADRALFAAGKWFAAMLASHRSLVPELGTFGLPHDELVRAAVAGINRNWLIANEQMKPVGNPGDVVIAEEMMSRRLTIQPWNIQVDPEGLIEAAVDSVRHIIFSSSVPALKRAGVGDILDALLQRSVVSSAYLTLESLWKDCLWSSSAVFEDSDVDIIRPTELRQAAAQAAAVFRGQTLRFTEYGEVHRSWKQMAPEIRAIVEDYRIVDEIRGSGRKLEIKTRRHRTDETPGAHALHMLGVGAWLDHTMNEELPKLAPLSPWLLLKGWDFLRSYASAAQRRMPQDTSVFDMTKLWSYAPSIPAVILRSSLAKSIGVSQQTATRMLDVFTMGSAKDADPWLTPLWRQGDRYFLMVPVAVTSNPRRLVEHWFTVGGVDLGIRGPLFESYVRAMCIDGIVHSSILNGGARCAPDGVELDPSVGNMDLVCLLGNTVLVSEIKCTTTPSSPVERANYLGILHEAADQVVAKLEHAKKNVAALAAATGWPLVAPNFVGVVITDQELGVGQRINGVSVVDHVIFIQYFQNPVLQHGVTFSPEGEKSVMSETKFYRTIGEAERDLEMYLLSPPQLRLALSHLKVVDTPLLTTPGMKPAVQRDFRVSLPS